MATSTRWVTAPASPITRQADKSELSTRWAGLSTTVYDTDGRIAAIIDPLNNRTSFAYNAAGLQVRTLNPLGKMTTLIYDAAGQVVDRIYSSYFPTYYVYNAAGRRIRFKDANHKITTTIYDAVGRTLATLDANGHRTTQVIMGAGQRLALVDANGTGTSFLYDAAGRQTQVMMARRSADHVWLRRRGPANAPDRRPRASRRPTSTTQASTHRPTLSRRRRGMLGV